MQGEDQNCREPAVLQPLKENGPGKYCQHKVVPLGSVWNEAFPALPRSVETVPGLEPVKSTSSAQVTLTAKVLLVCLQET